jgi:hypothetical protein
MHAVIMADGFLRPRSFRVEAYADSFEAAWDAGDAWIRAQPLILSEPIRHLSCERVPEESGVPL